MSPGPGPAGGSMPGRLASLPANTGGQEGLKDGDGRGGWENIERPGLTLYSNVKVVMNQRRKMHTVVVAIRCWGVICDDAGRRSAPEARVLHDDGLVCGGRVDSQLEQESSWCFPHQQSKGG
jgi:hypothetical protein